MDQNGQPLKTILEAARDRGMRTGLVSTTSIQHATPAAFSAHTTNRDEYAYIADQQSRANVSVMFGGGRRWALPKNKGGERTDGRDITEELERRGVQVLRSPHEFMNTRLRIPVHGFLAHDQMPFEIDRPQNEPSLMDFTKQALNLLNGSREGFFLMIEGGRIDHSFHDNDGGAAVREIDQFDQALEYAVNFARSTPNTVVLASADHETGGVTIGDHTQGYNWFPQVFAQQSKSAQFVEKLLKEGKDIRETVKSHMKIDLTPEQFEKIKLAVQAGTGIAPKVAQAVGNFAKIGYTTTGHTGVDVYSQGFGPRVDGLRGNHENTEIAKFIIGYLGLNMK
jgi:alkaline phosphatase